MNPGPVEPAKFGLALDQVTLPQVMKKAGYATGMVGKWHEGTEPPYHPTARGFDEYFGFLGGAHTYMKPGGGRNALLRGTEPVSEKEYLTDAFSREAVAYIDRHQEGPFFLYLAYNAVHNPQEVTEKYLARFPDEKDPKRKNMLAMLSAEDDGVGRVLEALRKNKLEENTLVFFFSDNGGPTEGNGSRNTPLSGYKGQVWEGGIRIPFMAQWKGKLPAGKVLDQPIIQLDIFATAAKLAGVEMPSDRKMDGMDLMPLMMGETEKAPHDALYWRFGPQGAVRSGDLKLVKFRGKADRLFDLSKDVSEKHDISDERAEDAKRLAGMWDAWAKELMAPRWKGKDKFQENLGSDAEQMGKKERRAARRRGEATTKVGD
jgi:arylsulfatase A-like enzyme